MEDASAVVGGDSAHDRPCRRLHRATIDGRRDIAGGGDDVPVGTTGELLELDVERRRPQSGSAERQVEDDLLSFVGKLLEHLVDGGDDLALLHRLDLAPAELDACTEDLGLSVVLAYNRRYSRAVARGEAGMLP